MLMLPKVPPLTGVRLFSVV